MIDYDKRNSGLVRIGGEDSWGLTGGWAYPFSRSQQAIIKASSGHGWEHVSVHIRYRNGNGKVRMLTPTWRDMCFVKDLFWRKDEVVVQFHPSEENYINAHPNVLHLWRPLDAELPTPPTILV